MTPPDETAPLVSLVDGPADGGSYYVGAVPPAPTCVASDEQSGLAGGCTVTGYDTSVGTHTVTATAADKAGNQGSASSTYTVLPLTLSVLYQPIDMNGVWNVVKNGSTVPLKFEVFAGTTELTDTSFIVQPLAAAQVACDGGVTDDVELLASGGTSLRYDNTDGRFVYNWQTPKRAGYCYVVTVQLADGSAVSANVSTK